MANVLKTQPSQRSYTHLSTAPETLLRQRSIVCLSSSCVSRNVEVSAECYSCVAFLLSELPDVDDGICGRALTQRSLRQDVQARCPCTCRGAKLQLQSFLTTAPDGVHRPVLSEQEARCAPDRSRSFAEEKNSFLFLVKELRIALCAYWTRSAVSLFHATRHSTPPVC